MAYTSSIQLPGPGSIHAASAVHLQDAVGSGENVCWARCWWPAALEAAALAYEALGHNSEAALHLAQVCNKGVMIV